VTIRQVLFDQRAKGTGTLRLTDRGTLGDPGCAVLSGTVERFTQERVTRSEVSVEAAMGQTGLFHDVSHTNAPEAGTANSPRRGLDDAVVGDLLSAGRDVHAVRIAQNMMTVIFV
jgi:hypothetical protein